jgi:hypothetical protein
MKQDKNKEKTDLTEGQSLCAIMHLVLFLFIMLLVACGRSNKQENDEQTEQPDLAATVQ